MEEISRLIEEGYECEYLDYKSEEYSQHQKEELIKDIMAMANAFYTGDKYIIVGIKDSSENKEIVGIDKLTDSSEYQELIHSNIEPEISFDYFPFDYKGKRIGIFRIYNNDNRPYIQKKDYSNKLFKGLCLIRRGSKKSRAIRADFDEFYKRKHGPMFKVPNSAERKLSLKDGQMQGIIKNGVLLRNVGDSIAYNTTMYLFLNVLITDQEFILAGDVPPMGEVSLDKLDAVIEEWIIEISKIKNKRYAEHISHSFYMLIEFTVDDGSSFTQTIEVGIAWGKYQYHYEISIGSSDGPISKPQKMNNSIEAYPQRDQLINKWRCYIEKREHALLEKIDDECRELALKMHQSSVEGVEHEVYKLFNYCKHAQMIGRALFAVSLIQSDKNSYKKSDLEHIMMFFDWLVDGANALNKRYYGDAVLEKELWDLISELEPLIDKPRRGRYTPV